MKKIKLQSVFHCTIKQTEYLKDFASLLRCWQQIHKKCKQVINKLHTTHKSCLAFTKLTYSEKSAFTANAHFFTLRKEAKSKNIDFRLSSQAFVSCTMLLIAACVASRFLLANKILHPCRASDLAVSYPIPALLPVIKAYFPDKSMLCST